MRGNRKAAGWWVGLAGWGGGGGVREKRFLNTPCRHILLLLVTRTGREAYFSTACQLATSTMPLRLHVFPEDMEGMFIYT